MRKLNVKLRKNVMKVIAKEIAKLEKRNIQNITKQTLKDNSNAVDLITKKYKRKQTFDNEKFHNLLEDLVNH